MPDGEDEEWRRRQMGRGEKCSEVRKVLLDLAGRKRECTHCYSYLLFGVRCHSALRGERKKAAPSLSLFVAEGAAVSFSVFLPPGKSR